MTVDYEALCPCRSERFTRLRGLVAEIRAHGSRRPMRRALDADFMCAFFASGLCCALAGKSTIGQKESLSRRKARKLSSSCTFLKTLSTSASACCRTVSLFVLFVTCRRFAEKTPGYRAQEAEGCKASHWSGGINITIDWPVPTCAPCLTWCRLTQERPVLPFYNDVLQKGCWLLQENGTFTRFSICLIDYVLLRFRFYFLPHLFFSLIHFGHFSHNAVETGHNSIH